MPTIPTAGPLSDAAVAQDLKNTKDTATTQHTASGTSPAVAAAPQKVSKTDAEWRAQLTSEQYHVLREKGTERPFTGALVNNHTDGFYHCAACNAPLFKSDTKFESGSGWPSFFDPVSNHAVELHEDRTFGMRRVEATCAACGSHLGHVFPDGPQPTGQRYCINSASLNFEKE